MLPFRRAARWFAAAFAVVALVHLGVLLAGGGVVADATQVLLMPLLAAVLWCETSAPRGRWSPWVMVALGLSWLGDSAPELALQGDPSFLVMVGFFLLAQVAYITAFVPTGSAVCCTCTGCGCSATSPSSSCSWGVRRRGRRDAGAGAALRRVPRCDGRALHRRQPPRRPWAALCSWSRTG